MTVATLIAVRPVLVDGHTLAPGSPFTVDAEHAAALMAMQTVIPEDSSSPHVAA
jgi:hypothetical protein